MAKWKGDISEGNNHLSTVNYNVNNLVLAEYNPRELTTAQHKSLIDSIKKFGLVDPLIVNTHKDRKNVLVGGHQRLKIIKELGYKSVACVEVNLSPDKEKELNVRLNKNTGQWDWDALSNNFDVKDLTDWGFTEDILFGTDNIIEDDSISSPKPSDDNYSVFELIMLHDNKLELLKVLTEIKDAEGIDKQEDALMELISFYKRNREND